MSVLSDQVHLLEKTSRFKQTKTTRLAKYKQFKKGFLQKIFSNMFLMFCLFKKWHKNVSIMSKKEISSRSKPLLNERLKAESFPSKMVSLPEGCD